MSKQNELVQFSRGASGGGSKNIIINGAMTIDQRNSGAALTPTSTYYHKTLDRWIANFSQASKLIVQQNAGSVTPPAGFKNYIGATQTGSTYTQTTNDAFSFNQYIEGNNIAHLDWGLSTAKNLILSFWVRSNVTGTYGAYIANSATNRIFVNSYTIDAANTWEKKSVSITGDTTGTWLTTNAVGMQFGLVFGAGSGRQTAPNAYNASADYAPTNQANILGTSGGYFYLTGVQLEVNDTATDFEVENYGTTLAKCQRYYFSLGGDAAYERGAVGYNFSTTLSRCSTHFPTTMRAAPSTSISGALYVAKAGSEVSVTSASNDNSSRHVGHMGYSVSSGLTAGDGATIFWNNNTTARIMFDAEL
jgi:hypothetical protein